MARLHAACFETPRPWTETEFAGLLCLSGVFLCTDGESGFALGRVLHDESELLTLAVAPEARRRGIGRRLLDGFEAQAAAAGASAAFLEVSAENRSAQQLYETQGYRHAGRRKGYYRAPSGERIDALILRRDLA